MDDRFRASDADRDRVADALREHYAAGRLSADELDERLTTALNARTLGELNGVLTDLPVQGGVLQDIAVAPDGSELYVAVEGGPIAIIDAAGDHFETETGFGIDMNSEQSGVQIGSECVDVVQQQVFQLGAFL